MICVQSISLRVKAGFENSYNIVFGIWDSYEASV